MALGKKCGSLKSSPRRRAMNGREEVDLGLKLGFGYSTRGFGRKRIAVLNNFEVSSMKKLCSSEMSVDSISGLENRSASPLESLPQDVLIRILCGVDHDDLEQLVRVSKTIREAACVAKQCHFAYTTPTKNRQSFRTSIDFDENDWSDSREIEAPGAPRQSRPCRSGLRRGLADISVALFASPEVDMEI